MRLTPTVTARAQRDVMWNFSCATSRRTEPVGPHKPCSMPALAWRMTGMDLQDSSDSLRTRASARQWVVSSSASMLDLPASMAATRVPGNEAGASPRKAPCAGCRVQRSHYLHALYSAVCPSCTLARLCQQINILGKERLPSGCCQLLCPTRYGSHRCYQKPRIRSGQPAN